MQGLEFSTLFPYTTLFRSVPSEMERGRAQCAAVRLVAVPARPGMARSQQQHDGFRRRRSEEHTSELQSHSDLVCRLLLEKKKLTAIRLLLTFVMSLYLLVR